MVGEDANPPELLSNAGFADGRDSVLAVHKSLKHGTLELPLDQDI